MLYLIFIISLIFSEQENFSDKSIKLFINNKICYQSEIKFFACYFSINALLKIEAYALVPKKILNNNFNIIFKDIKYAESFSLVERTDDFDIYLNIILKELNKIYAKHLKNIKKLNSKLAIDFDKILLSHLQYIDNAINKKPQVLEKIFEIQDLNSFTNYLDSLNTNYNAYISVHIVNEFLKTIYPYNALFFSELSIDDFSIYKPGFELIYDEYTRRLKVSYVYKDSDAFYKGVVEGMLLSSINTCFINDEQLYDMYAQAGKYAEFNFSFINPSLNIGIKLDKIVFASNYKFLNQLNNYDPILLNEPRNIFSVIDESLLYIKINYFYDDQFNSFNNNLNKIKENIIKLKPEGIILDLRNSQGGTINHAKSFLELFFNRETLLFIQKVDLKEDYLKNIYKGLIEVYSNLDSDINIPTIILTNDLTASSAEIIAGVFKELKNTTIIGSSAFTYGKSVAYIEDNFEDIYINNKISEVLLPVSKTSFDYIGIKSDIYIKNLHYNPSCFFVQRMKDKDPLFYYRNLNINFKKEARGIKTISYSFPYRVNDSIIYDYQYYFAKHYLLNIIK